MIQLHSIAISRIYEDEPYYMLSYCGSLQSIIYADTIALYILYILYILMKTCLDRMYMNISLFGRI